MIELAVFDVAGTIVEEHGSVYKALGDAASSAGATVTQTDVHRWMGADKREAITGLLTTTAGVEPAADVVDNAVNDFRARLAAAYDATPPRPLPGVPEALEKLRGAGIAVALNTGFDRQVLDGLLGRLDWDHGSVLDATVCVDEVADGRPAPYMIFRPMERTGVTDVSKVLTVGDTIRDLQAGTNAGAGMVAGVLTGGQTATELGAVAHTHLLDGVADLPELLRGRAG